MSALTDFEREYPVSYALQDKIQERRNCLPEPYRYKGVFWVETFPERQVFHYTEYKPEEHLYDHPDSIIFRRSLVYADVDVIFWGWVCAIDNEVYF